MRQNSRGFTLLEALIALVIFSVALLGLARMYTQMMSMSHSAYFRTLATIQANDLEERIRANPVAASDGEYELAACPAAGGATMAANDLEQWCNNTTALFGGLLVSASVEIVDNDGNADANGDNYSISFTWSERVQDDSIDDLEGGTVTFDYLVRR
jgi:type IV pilus assembly protein PilV